MIHHEHVTRCRWLARRSLHGAAIIRDPNVIRFQWFQSFHGFRVVEPDLWNFWNPRAPLEFFVLSGRFVRRCSGLTRRPRQTHHDARGTCAQAAVLRQSGCDSFARQRELEWHLELDARLITSSFSGETASRSRSDDRVERHGPPSRRKTRDAHQNRLPAAARRDAVRLCLRRDPPAFVNNTGVAAGEMGVFIRRLGGRHAADRPVRGRIDIAHREGHARQRIDLAGVRR